MCETRHDITFRSEGERIAGWHYPAPAASGAAPVIVMAHGFGAVIDMGLDRFARVFQAAGFAVLAFDYRRLGRSGGLPRQEIDPQAQIEDWRNAITHATRLPGVDGGRVGVWGTSYAGGHVLVLGATDPRIGCIVSQVPTISGNAVTKRRFTPAGLADIVAQNDADRAARMAGQAPQMRVLVSDDPAERPVYAAPEAVAWYLAAGQGTPFENRVTLRSLEYARGYEPGAHIAHIAPRPLLMIVADQDRITPTDLALDAFARAAEPKALERVAGDHFAPYGLALDQAAGAACAWFKRWLMPDAFQDAE